MRKRIWLPIAVLVLASVACSLFGRAEQAIELGKEAATRVSEVATVVGEEGGEAVATLIPESSGEESEAEESTESEPAAGEEAEEEAVEPQIDSDALAGLESYRTKLTSEWTPDEGEPQIISFEEARTRAPAARRMVMGGMIEDEVVEIVQIEDQSWMCSGGTCTQIAADPEELASGFADSAMFDPADTMDDADTEFLGREVVNGVQTRHYRLNMTPTQAAFAAEGDVSDMKGEVWVADEPDLPQLAVKFQMSWTEERVDLSGRTSFVYETYDINEPFTIEPPEGAETDGLPDDVPVYPNSEDTFAMQGMTSFGTPDAPSDVGEFYRQGLAAEGWTMDSDEEMPGVVQQTWKKGERTLTLMASEQDAGSSVIISIEDGS